MLEAEAADIADSFSRLYVARAEDHSVLRQVHERDHFFRPIDKRYLDLLIDEVKAREARRLEQGAALHDRALEWEKSFMARRTQVMKQWQSYGSFQSIWCETVQQTYGLLSADLSSGPFVSVPLCSALYTSRSMTAVHTRLFATTTANHSNHNNNNNNNSGGGAKVSPRSLVGTSTLEALNALFPLAKSVEGSNDTAAAWMAMPGSGDVLPSASTTMTTTTDTNASSVTAATATMLRPEIRRELFSARHACQVLLVLWSHALMRNVQVEPHAPSKGIRAALHDQKQAVDGLLFAVQHAQREGE